MIPITVYRTESLIAAGQTAAEHFERQPPHPGLLRSALNRQGLRSQTLAATLKVLTALADLDAGTSTATVHDQLRAVFLPLAKLRRLLRIQALLASGRERPGAATGPELIRLVKRLDRSALLLLSDRRAEGCAASARLGLGLVHHLLTGSHLPV